eukprot:UN16688
MCHACIMCVLNMHFNYLPCVLICYHYRDVTNSTITKS